MSVCAKFQLSSLSRSAWKVCVRGGVGGGVVSQSLYCQTQLMCCVVLGLGFWQLGVSQDIIILFNSFKLAKESLKKLRNFYVCPIVGRYDIFEPFFFRTTFWGSWRKIVRPQTIFKIKFKIFKIRTSIDEMLLLLLPSSASTSTSTST